MEHNVRQRSQEWFELRRGMVVTGSRFADAIGLGKGKPYDFLRSLIDEEEFSDVDTIFTRQGTEMEPIIHEAYDLLTGQKTRESGFWTLTNDENPLKDKIGVSPDAIVVDPATRKSVGVCEFKAPLYTMYRDIPRQYMVQMHGHMAVTGLQWCDFMAVCRSKKEIMLRRVHFCPQFWNFVASRLLLFCMAYKELNSLDLSTADRISAKNIEAVKQWNVYSQIPFESKVLVTDLLKHRNIQDDFFCGPSGHVMNFDLLMGTHVGNDLEKRSINFAEEIHKIDDIIEEERSFEAAMISCDY